MSINKEKYEYMIKMGNVKVISWEDFEKIGEDWCDKSMNHRLFFDNLLIHILATGGDKNLMPEYDTEETELFNDLYEHFYEFRGEI